ncbi:hypothetical protein BDW22DRAFT_634839 [Trametopsis cervina]|nr:hypothetical protein BDW22DRAFT_634839 [Trametopsis cervina]
MASSGKQNSRFSTLKVFKFGNVTQKPPPPPPKDPYYLPNHSLASLNQSLSPERSPPLPMQPITPLSATPSTSGYASSARSPSPSSSYMLNYAPSLAASRTTLAPSSSSMLSPDPAEPGTSRKGFFKFGSLGKRPKTPKSAASTSFAPPPEPHADPAEDPSISLPWNFQHNVHVDEIRRPSPNLVCVTGGDGFLRGRDREHLCSTSSQQADTLRVEAGLSHFKHIFITLPLQPTTKSCYAKRH